MNDKIQELLKPPVSERLKYLRETIPLDGATSKKHLAEIMKSRFDRGSVQSIIGWENGNNVPSTNALKMYAEIYGCTLDYLLGTSNDPSQTAAESNREMEAICKRIDQMFDEQERSMQIDFLTSVIDSKMIDRLAVKQEGKEFLIVSAEPNANALDAEVRTFYQTVLSEDQFRQLSEMTRVAVLNTINAFLEMSKTTI